MLELRQVSKRFGKQVAVREATLALWPGEIFGLLGPNGAGKTTLLRMAVNLLQADEGEVAIFGAPPRPEAMERIGYLPEERGLPTRAQVLSLLIYLGELKGLSRSGARDQARSLLKSVGLETRERSKIGELSKGNQQKIQLAAALIGAPAILLLDEPFSGLDPVNRALAVQLIRERVAQGVAALISTHQLQQVEQLCDRLALLNKGSIVLCGEVKAVRQSYADGSLLVRGSGDFASLPGVLRAAPVPQLSANGQQLIRLFLKPETTPNQFLQQALDQKLVLTSFEPHVPSLEDIFVNAMARSVHA